MNRSLLLSLAALPVLVVLAACGGAAPEPTAAPTQPAAATLPPSPEGYQGGAVTDGGTITGTVSYSGPPVEPEIVTVDKDNEVCGDTLELTPVQTDSAGGLANAVVRITDISSGKPLSELGSDFVLDQRGCLYSPSVVIVPVGSALTVLNSDGILHNVHTTPFDNPPLNVAQPGTQAEIASDEFTFAEIIPVDCDVHQWMHATIVAADNPYAVVTGADGSFTLTDVPAGTYRVEIWHLELGTQTFDVTVEAGGTTTQDAEF
jgi:plastocyanin